MWPARVKTLRRTERLRVMIRQRSARPVSQQSLAPALLLSMPQLTDPNFSKTVVLLCRHSDEGAFEEVLAA